MPRCSRRSKRLNRRRSGSLGDTSTRMPTSQRLPVSIAAAAAHWETRTTKLETPTWMGLNRRRSGSLGDMLASAKVSESLQESQSPPQRLIGRRSWRTYRHDRACPNRRRSGSLGDKAQHLRYQAKTFESQSPPQRLIGRHRPHLGLGTDRSCLNRRRSGSLGDPCATDGRRHRRAVSIAAAAAHWETRHPNRFRYRSNLSQSPPQRLIGRLDDRGELRGVRLSQSPPQRLIGRLPRWSSHRRASASQSPPQRLIGRLSWSPQERAPAITCYCQRSCGRIQSAEVDGQYSLLPALSRGRARRPFRAGLDMGGLRHSSWWGGDRAGPDPMRGQGTRDTLRYSTRSLFFEPFAQSPRRPSLSEETGVERSKQQDGVPFARRASPAQALVRAAAVDR